MVSGLQNLSTPIHKIVITILVLQNLWDNLEISFANHLHRKSIYHFLPNSGIMCEFFRVEH